MEKKSVKYVYYLLSYKYLYLNTNMFISFYISVWHNNVK